MKHLLFLFKVVLFLTLAFGAGAFIALTIELPKLAVAFGVFAMFLTLVPKAPAGALSALIVNDLITEFGNYYRAGSQNLKDIRIALMQKSETEEFFTSRLTTSTRLELASAAITRVLQSYQNAFTPIGDTTFKPQIINLDHIKVDVKILPHDLQESWLGFLADNALTPKDTPLVKFWLENLVIPKFKEDLELNEIFAGKKTAIVAGTAGAAGTSMNGIREKLKASDITTVTMGAVPTDPVLFVKYVEDYFASIPEAARNACKRIAMNKTLEQRYKQGKRAKYNQYYAQDTDLLKLADFDAKVVGLASHAPSNIIWTSPEDNKIVANKNPKNQSIFDIQPADREVKAFSDFHKGVGFWHNPLVFKTDISLTT